MKEQRVEIEKKRRSNSSILILPEAESEISSHPLKIEERGSRTLKNDSRKN